MFVTNKKDNIDEIIDMENDVDQMQIDYQNQQVKRLSKGVCGVEIGLIFTDMVIGLERIADHSTNIAYSISMRIRKMQKNSRSISRIKKGIVKQ